MTITQALHKARQEAHAVSGNWYAGQCYSSNKEAKVMRSIDIVIDAATKILEDCDKSLIKSVAYDLYQDLGITKQKELLERTIWHCESIMCDDNALEY